MVQTFDLESLLAELAGKKPGENPSDVTAHLSTGVDDTRPLFFLQAEWRVQPNQGAPVQAFRRQDSEEQ